MLTKQQIEQFHCDGYLLVPNLLSVGEVASLRSFFLSKFSLPPEQRYPEDDEITLYHIFSHYSEVSWLLFHEPTVSVLKSLLGDDFVMLESSILLNRFGGWHKDTTSQQSSGYTFCLE